MTTTGSTLEELESPDPEVRRRAIFTAVRDETLEARPPLGRIGSDDPSAELRYLARRALDVLSRLSSPGTGTPEDPGRPDEPVQLPGDLHGPDSSRRARALTEVARRGEASWLPSILERVGVEENPVTRARLVLTLGTLGGPKQIPVIRSFLEDADARVRANAVEALGSLDDPSVRPAIIEALRDSDHRVRLNALARVARFDPKLALEGCLSLLESGAYWVRDAAAHSLTTLEGPAVVPILVDLLKDRMPSIQRKAAKALRARADAEQPMAQAVLGQKAVQDRLDALEAPDRPDAKAEFLDLQRLPRPTPRDRGTAGPEDESPGPRSATGEIPFLARELAETDDTETIVEILQALAATDNPLVVDLIEPLVTREDPTIRWAAIRALADLGDAVPASRFTPHLDDSDPDIRCAAILACRARGVGDLEPRIKALFRDPDEAARESAIDLAVELGDRWLVEELRRLKDEDPVHEVAEKADFAAMMLAARPDEGPTSPS